MFFSKSNLYPKVFRVHSLSEYDETLWLSIRPKVLPRPFNIISIAVFYYSQIKISIQNENSSNNCRQVLILSLLSIPMLDFFLVADANGLKMDSLRSSLKVKQIVKIPTTRGNTSLDVILTNMYNSYSPPPLSFTRIRWELSFFDSFIHLLKFMGVTPRFCLGGGTRILFEGY